MNATVPSSPGQQFKIGDHVVVDFQNRKIAGSNPLIALRPKDWAVLQLLVQRAPDSVSRDEFWYAVWDGEPAWNQATLHTSISKLRKALAVAIESVDGTWALATPVDALVEASLPAPSLPFWKQYAFLRRWAIAATVLALGLAIALIVVLWRKTPGAPVIGRWSGPVFTAFDSEERPVWRHRFPYPIMDTSRARHFDPLIGDFDGNGSVETLVVYAHNRREEEGWGLYCLSSTGQVAWSMSPRRTVQNSTSSFKAPYVIREFTSFPSPDRDGTIWTAAVFVHHTNYPSVLMVVDSHGATRGEYWHVGHLQSVRTFGPNLPRLVVGGVQHGAEQAVLLVFDPKNVHGASQVDVSAHGSQFQGMRPGTQLATVYIPRSRYNLKNGKFNIVDQLHIIGKDVIQASVYEHVGQRQPKENQPEAYLIYRFKPSLELEALEISVAYNNALKLDPELAASQFPPQEEISDLKKRIRVVWSKL